MNTTLQDGLNETDEKRFTLISKLLSLVLRHQPQTLGLNLDGEGWTPVETLLTQLAAHGKPVSRGELDAMVRTNAKQRFAYSEDGARIRANQGHSVNIDLQLAPQAPPEFLYHGTVGKVLEAIRKAGLQKMNRQHVHLSADRATAVNVGSRRGQPVVLTVRSGDMHQSGLKFYRSDNGVWLTEEVPPLFIEFK